MPYLRITLLRSAIGLPKPTLGVLKALGLRKRLATVYHPISPSVAGQVFRVKELVDVQEVEERLTREEMREWRRPESGFWVEKRVGGDRGGEGKTLGQSLADGKMRVWAEAGVWSFAVLVHRRSNGHHGLKRVCCRKGSKYRIALTFTTHMVKSHEPQGSCVLERSRQEICVEQVLNQRYEGMFMQRVDPTPNQQLN
ncbi:39S ribosomal protein L33, mitochondrial [Elasticomyces elasticus]|nr:39S ribosomal protein L33, mitochondrial [Elasticomyces elasticus]